MEQVKASGAINTPPPYRPADRRGAGQAGEGDAAIVWKENAGKDGLTILENSGMEKTTLRPFRAPSSLARRRRGRRQGILNFCRPETAKNIWTKFGYELVTHVCGTCQNVTEAASATSSRHCACW